MIIFYPQSIKYHIDWSKFIIPFPMAELLVVERGSEERVFVPVCSVGQGLMVLSAVPELILKSAVDYLELSLRVVADQYVRGCPIWNYPPNGAFPILAFPILAVDGLAKLPHVEAAHNPIEAATEQLVLARIGEIAYSSVVRFAILPNELIPRVEIDGGDLISAGERGVEGVEPAGPNCVFVLGKLPPICGVFMMESVLSCWSSTE